MSAVNLHVMSSHVMSTVNLPAGPTIRISGVGTLRLNNDILLKNVLFIPKFRMNLRPSPMFKNQLVLNFASLGIV